MKHLTRSRRLKTVFVTESKCVRENIHIHRNLLSLALRLSALSIDFRVIRNSFTSRTDSVLRNLTDAMPEDLFPLLNELQNT